MLRNQTAKHRWRTYTHCKRVQYHPNFLFHGKFEFELRQACRVYYTDTWLWTKTLWRYTAYYHCQFSLVSYNLNLQRRSQLIWGPLGLVSTELRATGSRLWLAYGGIEGRMLLVKVLTEVCSLENIASWNRRKVTLAWSGSVLLTSRSLVCIWKTCRKGG